MSNHVQDIKQRFGLIGHSPLLNRAILKAIQVAGTDISVLVTGESGVGKESIPRIIHALSARKHHPYIAVNCGAIPEGTIDSELFGHEKGAFTGASQLRKGYFEEAHGGTIFLDEVGELPLSTQVRLLRVLETGEFIKVGSSKIQKTDVRIVAATNVNMQNAIKNNKFREDMYYRLNTVEIHLPALRERPEDVLLLFRKFAADFAEKYRLPGLKLSEDAGDILGRYRWPGNIRQLRNLAEQISVVEHDRYINSEILLNYLPEAEKSDLPVALGSFKNESDFASEREILYKILFDMRNDINDLKKLTLELMKHNGSVEAFQETHEGLISKVYGEFTPVPQNRFIPVSTQDNGSNVSTEIKEDIFKEAVTIDENDTLRLDERELELIKKALERNKGKRRNSARELGISERTLYRKINQYGL